MMALLKFALLLFIGLFGSALTSEVEADGLKSDQKVPMLARDDSQNGDSCQNCTEIFELLTEFFSNADIQDKVFNKTACDDPTAPPVVSKICRGEAKNMIPYVFNLIFSVMKQKHIVLDSPSTPHILARDAGLVFPFPTPDQISQDSHYRLLLGSCPFCKYVINSLINSIPGPVNENTVVEAMKKVCEFVPPYLRPECSYMIEKSGKDILDSLVHGIAPTIICHSINMC